MKTLKNILFLSVLITFSSSTFAQSPGIPGEIIAAVSQGSAAKLSPYLGSNIELVIENKNDIYSKQQAIEIISDFFRKNSVADFKILHSGVKDTSSFAIGTLRTSNGLFRVYILTRRADGKSLIQQLRIESTNE